MPKVIAYRGYLSLVGSNLHTDDGSLLVLEEKVYAETIGLLYDQLKLACVRMIDVVEAWITTMPNDYSMQDDRWFLSYSYPSPSDEYDAEEYDEDDEYGQTIDEPFELLHLIARNLEQNMLFTMAQLDNAYSSTLSLEYEKAMNSQNIKQMMNAGMSGLDFDTLFASYEANGTIDMLRECNREKALRLSKEQEAKINETKKKRILGIFSRG